jgi:hypothetical protein
VNDILRWAKEADLWMTSDERIAAVERFATLVRADEREQCAKVCDDAAIKLFCGKSRVNQVDRHTAEVLRSKAATIRARKES